MTRILGISAFYHDSAAALVEDGRIVAAAQEERFSRKKHDHRFPERALRYCLAEAGIGLGDVDHVVFYDKPLVKFERLLETYLAFSPRGLRSFVTAMPVWLKEKLYLKALLKRELAALAGAPGAPLPKLLFTRAPPGARGGRVLPEPVRGGRGAVPRRRRRVGDDLRVDGTRPAHLAAVGNRLPALARPALLGVHLLLRLPGELGRVQADGPGALRRAALRAARFATT